MDGTLSPHLQATSPLAHAYSQTLTTLPPQLCTYTYVRRATDSVSSTMADMTPAQGHVVKFLTTLKPHNTLCDR